MTTVLELTDGVDTIDFITSSSDFMLHKDGLELPPPEPVRVLGGDPLIREGQALKERRFNNREIIIDFQLKGSDHDDFVRNARLLQRILESAKIHAKDSLSSPVTLEYKLTNASDSVSFDILDGDIEFDQTLAHPTLERSSLLNHNTLSLIARPFAKGAILHLDNWLINGDFENNGSESGRDGITYLHHSNTEYLQNDSCAGLICPSGEKPEILAYGWIRPTSSPAGYRTIAYCGVGNSDQAWSVRMTSADKVQWVIWNAAGASKSLVSDDALTIDAWNFIACVAVVVSSTWQYMAIYINNKMVDYADTGMMANMRQTTGKFQIGSGNFTAESAEGFPGDICGFGVILKSVWGYQIDLLYRYGSRSIVEGWQKTAAGVIDADYWDIGDDEYGAVWLYDEPSAASRSDSGPKAITLTAIGSPTVTNNQRNPGGWTVGSGIGDGSDSGLKNRGKVPYDTQKYGVNVYHLNDQNANAKLSQTITVTSRFDAVGDLWTFLFWVYGNGSTNSIQAKLNGSSDTVIPVDGEWRQYIKTCTNAGPSFDIGFERTSSPTPDVFIDGVQVLQGHPYGIHATIEVLATTDIKPFISSRFLRNIQDSGKFHHLGIYDLPGDQLAACRLFIVNNEADKMGPVRAGLIRGAHPAKLQTYWRASQWIPQSTDSDIGGWPYLYSPNWVIYLTTLSESAGLKDLCSAALSSLYPFALDQRGMARFIGACRANVAGTYHGIGTIRSFTGQDIYMTSDPTVQTASSSVFRNWDFGITSWPPMISPTKFRAAEVSGQKRQEEFDQIAGVLLKISGGDNAASLHIKDIFVIPCEHGYFAMYPLSSIDKSWLEEEEAAVADSIDPDSRSGYVAKYSSRTDKDIDTILALEATAIVPIVGDSFHLLPNDNNTFTILADKKSEDLGEMDETHDYVAFIEVEPRYLYV